MEFSDQSIQDNTNQAYAYLIKLLSKQNYSTFKLKLKLQSKSYSDHVIDAAINKVIQQGFHNESLYTELRIKSLMKKGHSPYYIDLKLQDQQIYNQESFIDKIFLANGVTELTQQKELLDSKLPKNIDAYSFEEQKKIKEKAFRYLISKGHEPLLELLDY